MIVIAIESIVGAGKTTLIHECLLPILTERGWKVTIVDEPVSKWKKDGLLKLFYEDPGRYAYHFQTKAFHDRVRECQEQFDRNGEDTDVFLLERSVFSDNIFMETLYELENVTDMEMKHYKNWWCLWEEVMPFQPDLFVHLKPDVDVCMSRVKERSREGESHIKREYQTLLQEKHDKFFTKACVEVSKGHYIPVLNLETNANFRDDTDIKHKIADLLENKLSLIKNSKIRKS